MAAAKKQQQNGYVPRLKQLYEQELRPRLKDQLGVSSTMEVPRVSKVTLNMGVGEAKTEAKALDNAVQRGNVVLRNFERANRS